MFVLALLQNDGLFCVDSWHIIPVQSISVSGYNTGNCGKIQASYALMQGAVTVKIMEKDNAYTI